MKSAILDLIRQASLQYGDIRPAAGRPTLEQSVSLDAGLLILWFNTQDNSTHIVSIPLNVAETCSQMQGRWR